MLYGLHAYIPITKKFLARFTNLYEAYGTTFINVVQVAYGGYYKECHKTQHYMDRTEIFFDELQRRQKISI